MHVTLLLSLLGLVSGIITTCGIPENRHADYLVPLVLAVFLAKTWRSNRSEPLVSTLLSAFAGFLLFFLTGFTLVNTTQFKPLNPIGEPCNFQAEVISYREMTEKLGQLVVRVTGEAIHGQWNPQSGRLVLQVRPDTAVQYRPGDVWMIGPVRLKPISNTPAKSGFVPRRYWISKGIRYEARLPPGNGKLLETSHRFRLPELFGNWQSRLAGRIDNIPLSQASRALIKAMVLGDRKDVDGETMTDFSRAGIIHVLSVSGLHVGIVYFIIAWILSKPGLLGARVRSLLCLAAVWLYAGLTGGSTSALRSAGMITLFEIARIGRRGTGGLEVLTGTALIHCLIDPYTVFSAGAQLSYLAVAGIFIWNPVFNPMVAKLRRIPAYFAGALAVSLSAQSLITPLLLFWFGWFPIYFLIGNLVLLPVMVFCFYLGSLITLVDYAGVTIPIICKLMDFLIRLVANGAGWLGNLPGNLFQPKGLIWCDLILYYLVIFAIRSYLVRPRVSTVRVTLAGTGLLLAIRTVITGV